MNPYEGWVTLSVDAPPRGQEVYLVEALRRVGARVVEPSPEGGYVALFTPGATRSGGFLPQVRAAVRAATSLRDPELRLGQIGAEDWAGRRASELRPLPVGTRLLVAPEGSEPGRSDAQAAPASGRLLLRLRVGTAFGTAEHPTTRLCLEALEQVVAPGSSLLDVGSGSGILSIAGALLGAGRVLGLETDPHACGEARANATLNGVSERVELRRVRVTGATRPTELVGEAHFDTVVANVERPVLLEVLDFAAGAVAPGGTLILSGVPRHEAEAPIAAAGDAGFFPLALRTKDGWWCGSFERQGGADAAR